MGMVTVDPDNTSVFIMEMLMAEGVKFPGPWEDIGLKISDEIARSHDPDIAGLELTEAICVSKITRERHTYREAVKLFLVAAMQETPEQRLEHLDAALAKSRTLLTQSSEGE